MKIETEKYKKSTDGKVASEFLEKPSYELHGIYRALDVLGAECDLIQAEVYNQKQNENHSEKSKERDKLLCSVITKKNRCNPANTRDTAIFYFLTVKDGIISSGFVIVNYPLSKASGIFICDNLNTMIFTHIIQFPQAYP